MPTFKSQAVEEAGSGSVDSSHSWLLIKSQIKDNNDADNHDNDNGDDADTNDAL